MREPLVAGQFYKKEFEELDKQIKECFYHEKGPAELPLRTRKGKITGIIAPHAGYQFSGPCAAWAYKKLAESKFTDNFILLGPSHLGSNEIMITKQDFKTPFGILKNNNKICDELLKYPFIKENDDAHQHEHSIETQLPFLQFANKNYLQNIKIIPILVGNYDKRLAEAITDLEDDFTIIASSDFTHYGPSFGYVPFVFNKQESMYKLDNEIIKKIKSLDTEDFLNFTKNKTVCGRLPIAILMDIAKWYKSKAKLLQYYTSGDIVKDYTNAVGYASIVFE